jgi:hypothetical protein
MIPLKSNEFYTSYDASHLKDGGIRLKTMAIFATDNEDDIRMVYDPVPGSFLPVGTMENPVTEDKFRVHCPYFFNPGDVFSFNHASHKNYTTLWMRDALTMVIRIPFEMFLELRLQK